MPQMMPTQISARLKLAMPNRRNVFRRSAMLVPPRVASAKRVLAAKNVNVVLAARQEEKDAPANAALVAVSVVKAGLVAVSVVNEALVAVNAVNVALVAVNVAKADLHTVQNGSVSLTVTAKGTSLVKTKNDPVM